MVPADTVVWVLTVWLLVCSPEDTEDVVSSVSVVGALGVPDELGGCTVVPGVPSVFDVTGGCEVTTGPVVGAVVVSDATGGFPVATPVGTLVEMPVESRVVSVTTVGTGTVVKVEATEVSVSQMVLMIVTRLNQQ